MSSILKNKDKYLDLAKSGVDMNKKANTKGQNSLLEQILYDWYIVQKKANINVTGPMLRTKAEELAVSGTDPCSFSVGWLDGFKRRFNIQLKNKKSADFKAESQNNSLLEQILYQWVVHQQQSNLIVSGPALKAKAEELSKVCSSTSPGFKFTTGWLDAFKKRHDIRFRTSIEEEPDRKPPQISFKTSPPHE